MRSSAVQERVDLVLVFLQGASRSIDDVKIKLQREGYAAAITHPDVLDTILGGYYRRIVVTYVEWGDETSQEIVVPWTIIDGPRTATSLAQILQTAPRLASGPNALGSAIALADTAVPAW